MTTNAKIMAGMGLAAALLIGNSGWAGTQGMASWATDLQPNGYQVLPVVNQDQFGGKWKQFKGDLKKQYGKLTDDDILQIEGNYDKFQGKLQERYGDQKEEIQRWTDEWYKKHGSKKK